MTTALLISGDLFAIISNDAYDLLSDKHFDSTYSISRELDTVTVSAPGKEDIVCRAANSGELTTQLEEAIIDLSPIMAESIADHVFAIYDHIDLVII